MRKSDRAMRKSARAATVQLFEATQTAPGIGGLDLSTPLSEFTLPPEVVLFEPSPEDIHRGGKPAPQGKNGNRLIFLNVPLLDFEQKALDKLHEALKNEKALAPGGTMPGYVRLHALRLLQQAKWKVEKAICAIATHLEMRVQKMPVNEAAVLEDLQSAIMYWHGRDRCCRPILVWRMEKIQSLGLDADRVTRMILFILEYGVRYLMVPGRVENWILMIDLSRCGLSMAASSAIRSIARNVTRLCEEVYCGRNFTTKIFHMPSLLRAIVNSLIPEDKKSKVEFVAPGDIASTMRKLCEPHQLEEQYGGTAPNVQPGEVYPFRFFPHCRGPKSGGNPPLTSLHRVADRAFHEGVSLDLYEKDSWKDALQHQALSRIAAKAISKELGETLTPTTTLDGWLEKLGGSEASKYREALEGEGAKTDDFVQDVEEEVTSLPQSKSIRALSDDILNQDGVKKSIEEEDINKSQLIQEKRPLPEMEGESSAVCCVCTA